MKIKISNGGKLTFIYADNTPALKQGKPVIRRVSFVEPHPDGGWTADMSPVAPGIVLGPFPTRQKALYAEVEFLDRQLFGTPHKNGGITQCQQQQSHQTAHADLNQSSI